MKKGWVILISLLLISVIGLLMLTNSKEGDEVSGLFNRLENGQDVRFLVIGDSIGHSTGVSNLENSWTELISNSFENEFNVRPTIDLLTKGGSDSFDGLLELNKFETEDNYDLVFLVYGQNDQKLIESDQFSNTYEKLVNNVIVKFPTADVVTITESHVENETIRNAIANISADYGLLHIDTYPPVQEVEQSGTPLADDGVHPNDKGYEIYANLIFDSLKKRYEEMEIYQLPSGKEVIYSETKLNKHPQYINGFLDKETYLVSNSKNASLEYEFKGNLVGVAVINNRDGGKFDVYIDGEKRKTIDAYSAKNVERYFLVDDQLEYGDHTVTIIPTEENRRTSIGNIVRISGIITSDEN
ncbi:GDSL-type esterase/lipase family protein [Halalkalibacter lacteus]|uniref:GDSL-type esterase/lipase family protein n=1 Tax=Halalkalibacter lacteus TaxID=3090663 RepID=UPI002FC9D70B